MFILAILPAAEGQVIHVNADAIGANDGSCWENAYNYLQDALADANSMPKPVEIRVAQSIYKPDQGADVMPGNQMATFQLINGVAVRGSYAGFGELDHELQEQRLVKVPWLFSHRGAGRLAVPMVLVG